MRACISRPAWTLWAVTFVASTASARPAPPLPAAASSPPAISLTPDEDAFARRQADAELERWTRERTEELRDAIDPGEKAEHTHLLRQADMESGRTDAAHVFLQGEALFDRRFTLDEGLGTGSADVPRPALSRVERATQGPDALSCRECHARGGDDGHGELHQRAWLGGDGRHLGTAHPRVPPHVAGLGLVQILAAEMTAELGAQAERVRKLAIEHHEEAREPLVAKGVGFGEIAAGADGTLDASGVRGVDPDLVVRPFGWRGSHDRLRTFLRQALPQHMGLEPLPVASEAAGAGSWSDLEKHFYLHDEDKDGIAGEIQEGQLTALAVYLALLDVPVVLPPRTDEALAAWTRGASLFRQVGCDGCHRPAFPIDGVRWTERATASGGKGFEIDLGRDNQVAPGPDTLSSPIGRAEVRLYSDLRRHDLGPALAERAEGHVGPSEFLTRPLWGLGDRGPYYLHDGRARTLAAAIRLHGGEAAGVVAAYERLDGDGRRAIDVFLLSLRRAPQGRIVP